MKQIILPSTVFEFTWLVIDGIMEENGIASFSKKEIRTPNTEGHQEIWNIPRPWLQQTKSFSPPQKNCLWVGVVIIMKGDQKWEIVEFTIGIFFCLFLLEICIHYFLYREFSSPT